METPQERHPGPLSKDLDYETGNESALSHRIKPAPAPGMTP